MENVKSKAEKFFDRLYIVSLRFGFAIAAAGMGYWLSTPFSLEFVMAMVLALFTSMYGWELK